MLGSILCETKNIMFYILACLFTTNKFILISLFQVQTDLLNQLLVLQHERTSVELWYLNSLVKVFALEGENRVSFISEVHGYT